MTAKEAWNNLIFHCRYLGIPVHHRPSQQLAKMNGHKVEVVATVNQVDGWEENFRGAFIIVVRFPEKGRITWWRTSLLLHEIGHVLDFRANMIMFERGKIQEERIANWYAMNVVDLLEIPKERIRPHLNRIIAAYEKIEEDK